VSSRTARAIHKNPVLKNQKKKKKIVFEDITYLVSMKEGAS
jgi:hypothetical protein